MVWINLEMLRKEIYYYWSIISIQNERWEFSLFRLESNLYVICTLTKGKEINTKKIGVNLEG